MERFFQTILSIDTENTTIYRESLIMDHGYERFFMKYLLVVLTMLAAVVSQAQIKVRSEKSQYPTVAMKERYAEKDRLKQVIYLTDEQREAYRVEIRSGIVYTASGKVYPDTKNDTPEHIDLINYVMDTNGNIYIFDEYKFPKIRHSSLFAAAPIAGGGEIQVKDGRVTHIDPNSGHYDTAQLMKNVLSELSHDGVDINGLGR